MPYKHVTVSTKIPTFITPLMKHLLRKHNKLMCRGLYTKADEITVKIGWLIAETQFLVIEGQ